MTMDDLLGRAERCPFRRPDIALRRSTSCVEISVAGRAVFDVRTGFRVRRDAPEKSKRPVKLPSRTRTGITSTASLLWPSYEEGNRLEVFAGHLSRYPGGIRAVHELQMSPPLFPVSLDSLKADLSFQDFMSGDSFAIGDDLRVRTCALAHPNGATAYRVESGGQSVCYVTDTEHEPGRPDERILELIDGASLVIYDCTYRDEEFPGYVGWGHSTWQEAARLPARGRGEARDLPPRPFAHDDARCDEREARFACEGFVARGPHHHARP
jgi:phosphoribosyl 1,2-cyclic phosphodiesterase